MIFVLEPHAPRSGAGATLHGSEDGIDPLDSGYDPTEPNGTTYLSLGYNGTKRARWDARLGWDVTGTMLTRIEDR